jgi:hypothetical protein
MQSWLELESRFQALAPKAQYLRADFQWGDAGEYSNIAGMTSSAVTAQFIGLTQIAGKHLTDVLPKTEQTHSVLSKSDYGKRWLYALKEWSGAFQFLHHVKQIDDAGNNAGYIYTGQINDIVATSAVLCLYLQSHHPVNQTNTSSSMTVNNYLVNSQIGLLNTGDINHVKSISINVGRLQEQGHLEVAKTIKEVLEAVTASDAWEHPEKAELLDLIEELSKQAVLPPDERAKSGTIKSIIGSIGAAIGTAASLSELWSMWGPMIRTFFQV